jgi:histidinol phosphatase-like enzyme (inositol monophosphatase family)
MLPFLENDTIRFTEELADSARTVSLRHFRNVGSIEYKADDTPVSVADRETEARIRELILKRYPDHGVLGEEFGHDESESPWLWVIDPIDGTRSYITGKPTFGCLIALLYEHQPVLGIIDMPVLDERWVGVKGQPSKHCGNPCQSSHIEHLAEATLFATSIDMFTDIERNQFDLLSSNTRFRNFGADCYAYGLLASGHTDIVMESDMNPYDFLARVPIVEGAGGCISDWQGKPLDFFSDKQVLASANSVLHKKSLTLLSTY